MSLSDLPAYINRMKTYNKKIDLKEEQGSTQPRLSSMALPTALGPQTKPRRLARNRYG